jgi:hypothetical protein
MDDDLGEQLVPDVTCDLHRPARLSGIGCGAWRDSRRWMPLVFVEISVWPELAG